MENQDKNDVSDREAPAPVSYIEQPAPPPPYYGEVVGQPIKQRRVGTFTLGLALILIGIIIPLTMMFKDKALMVLQFSPIVLVMLGIEVLTYAYKIKGGRLKYDGFSIFLVLMITVVSIGTATIAPLITQYIDYEKALDKACYEQTAVLEDIIAQNELDANVSIYSNYYGYNSFWSDYDGMEPQLRANMVLYWEDSANQPTKQEVIAKLLPFIKDIDGGINELSIQIDYKENRIAALLLNNLEIKNVTEQLLSNDISQHRMKDRNGMPIVLQEKASIGESNDETVQSE